MSVPQQLDADRIISANVRCPDGSKWSSTKCWNYLSKMQNATLRRFFLSSSRESLCYFDQRVTTYTQSSSSIGGWIVTGDLEASIYYSSPNRHAALSMRLCSCLGRKTCLNSSYFFQYAMPTEILSFPLLQGKCLQILSLDMTNSTIMKEDLYRVFCSSPADHYSHSSKHTHHMDHWHTLRNATLS